MVTLNKLRTSELNGKKAWILSTSWVNDERIAVKLLEGSRVVRVKRCNCFSRPSNSEQSWLHRADIIEAASDIDPDDFEAGIRDMLGTSISEEEAP